MNPVKRSLITLHLTVVLLGGTALFSHLIPLNATDITIGRSVFACLALFIYLLWTGESLKLARSRDYFTAFGLGALMAAHWVSYFAAMQYASISVGLIALFTFPVITVFMEPFFEAVKLKWQDVVSAIVVLTGIYLLVPTPDLNNNITLGVAIGIASAILYSLRNLLHRQYFSHYGGAKAMAWQILVICIVLIPVGSSELTDLSIPTGLLLATLGTLFTALPHALIANSLIYLRAKTFSLIACMQPLYGVFLAVVLLNETPELTTLLGGLLIISASIYETVNTGRSHQQEVG
ncbi:DMT family transporter [Alteromonas sp. ASW11-130]|uniref:DMT family transporter n=1 Tax=Alteromonas sp. ASW11-130 TaxID=3015775 RepID=UPI002241B913|nr:DMT family transporter [Alteromonas sp. ASW11-130]MCW8090883.1 DMT family transporter [Alteromonas sp. ASW11-130]